MIEKRLNPFINALTVPYIEMVQRVEFDEKEGTRTIGYRVESERHTRLYISPPKRVLLFRQLSPSAFKLFWLVVYSTNPDQEYVVMSYEKVNAAYSEEGDRPVSPRGYKDALRELISLNLIDAKDLKNDQYWVNPSFFCPGNRLDMYPQCAVKVLTRQAKSKELN